LSLRGRRSACFRAYSGPDSPEDGNGDLGRP
jgi:hypothetical protein